MSETMYKWGVVLLLVGIILAIIAMIVPMNPNPQLMLIIVAAIIAGFGALSMAVNAFRALR